jgi:hypothetical protein
MTGELDALLELVAGDELAADPDGAKTPTRASSAPNRQIRSLLSTTPP